MKEGHSKCWTVAVRRKDNGNPGQSSIVHPIYAAPGVGRKQNTRLLVEAALLHAFGDGLEPTRAKVESQRLGKLSAGTCPKEQGLKMLGHEVDGDVKSGRGVQWGHKVDGDAKSGLEPSTSQKGGESRPQSSEDRRSSSDMKSERKVDEDTKSMGTQSQWDTKSMGTQSQWGHKVNGDTNRWGHEVDGDIKLGPQSSEDIRSSGDVESGHGVEWGCNVSIGSSNEALRPKRRDSDRPPVESSPSCYCANDDTPMSARHIPRWCISRKGYTFALCLGATFGEQVKEQKNEWKSLWHAGQGDMMLSACDKLI
ncbi:hypothetical protein JB92DRAFT_2827052 [Gautieria morchelliformis]|nr:hypothetical protein JB92DRAFT_2827052 [Gautieria morchelliformis]